MDFARYAITRPVNIWILVLICLLGGTLAFFEIGRPKTRNSPSSEPSSTCSTPAPRRWRSSNR